MFEADRGQPAAVGLGPTPHAAVRSGRDAGEGPAGADGPCRARGAPSPASAPGRALPRGRHPAPDGISSPARCSLAIVVASRRLVLTRSSGRLGISDGATTRQSWLSIGIES
jgi:hypothetical protein